MFYICYGCSFIKGTAAFRVPWGLQMVPAILLLFGLFFLPESPRWLAKHGRWEEALDTLALVHAHGDKNDAFVRSEMKEIRDEVEFDAQNSDVSWIELFKPGMLNRVHIGVFTQIWSQLTGMNVMMYYITVSSGSWTSIMRFLTTLQYVFAMANLKGNNILLSSSIQYVINVIMTIPALIWIDRWGRRPMFLVGAAFMMLWLFINAGTFTLTDRVAPLLTLPGVMATYGHAAPAGGLNGIAAESWILTGKPAKVIIAMSYLFVASFAPTWGPASWAYPPELFPLRVRGKAVALCTSANWAFNFALGYFVPPAFQNIQWKVHSHHPPHNKAELTTRRSTFSSVSSVPQCSSTSFSCSPRQLANRWRRSRPCSLIHEDPSTSAPHHGEHQWSQRHLIFILMRSCLTTMSITRGHRMKRRVLSHQKQQQHQ